MDGASDLSSNSTEHSISFRWQTFADTLLFVPLHFKVLKSDSVTETIEAKFVELIEPVRIDRELTNVLTQSNFKRTEILRR